MVRSVLRAFGLASDLARTEPAPGFTLSSSPGIAPKALNTALTHPKAVDPDFARLD